MTTLREIDRNDRSKSKGGGWSPFWLGFVRGLAQWSRPPYIYVMWAGLALSLAAIFTGCASTTWPPAQLDGRELHQCQWVPETGGGKLIECCAWKGDSGYRVLCDTGEQ